MLVCYIVFSISLCLWEVSCGAPLHVSAYEFFALCLVVAGVFGWFFFRNDRLLRLIVLIMLIFINLGGAVAAGVQTDVNDADTFNGYLADFGLMLVTFPVIYLLIRWLGALLRNDKWATLKLQTGKDDGRTRRNGNHAGKRTRQTDSGNKCMSGKRDTAKGGKTCRTDSGNSRLHEERSNAEERGIRLQDRIHWIIAVFSVAALVEAGLLEREVNGSHIYFLGVFMVFGIAIFCYPFVAAFAFSKPERAFLLKRVNTLSRNMVLFLLYTVLMFYASAKLCNEFGLVLVLLVTATVLFFDRCKNRIAKFGYSITCAGFAWLICQKVSRIHVRVQVWLDLEGAVKDKNLSASADVIKFLFQTLSKAGFWGKGIGSMVKTGAYQALNSDYVLITLIHDYSLFIALMAVVLGVVLVWCLLHGTEGCAGYDRYLNLSLALIIGTIILIHVASNLGSFITSGIGFPWISDGGMNNIALTGLVAVHCGLVQRQKYGFQIGRSRKQVT